MCRSSTTNEMLHSDEPWAMAMMFTPSRPSALNVLPATPGVPCMFSPTTATTAIFGSTVMCSTFSCATSWTNSLRNASTVRFASEEATMKQISFCEEDCEINKTFARAFDVVEKVRPTTSGTPTIPGPPTVISVTSFTAVSALTPPPLLLPCGVILVPVRSGSKRFGVQHFGAKVCQLRGFAIRDLRNRACVRHKTRVRRQDAVHIRPNDDFIRIQRRAQYRR